MFYQAILFDMDGVIVDTHQAVTDFWQRWSSKYHVELSQTDFQQHIYGCPANHTLDVLFSHLSSTERQAINTDMVTYEINQTYTAVKGVITFLRTLQAQNFPIALVTSGEHWKVNAVLTQLQLEHVFTATVTVADIPRGKPNPDCYLLAAQHLNKLPEQCIVFEDALSGVKAAIAAGALCIGVQPWDGKPLLQAGARYVVPDFTVISLQAGANSSDSLQLQVGAVVTLSLHPGDKNND
jgi:HAD superfamily hydrolase (TIGR01509 family)